MAIEHADKLIPVIVDLTAGLAALYKGYASTDPANEPVGFILGGRQGLLATASMPVAMGDVMLDSWPNGFELAASVNFGHFVGALLKVYRSTHGGNVVAGAGVHRMNTTI